MKLSSLKSIKMFLKNNLSSPLNFSFYWTLSLGGLFIINMKESNQILYQIEDNMFGNMNITMNDASRVQYPLI